jgi:hypothetical protein
MRESESCASFFVGSSCDVAMRSAYVTRPASAPAIGGSEWHPVQFDASIVATSHGTPVAAAVPPSLLPPDDEAPPEPLEDDVPEELAPVDPAPDEDPVCEEPEPRLGTTMIFSSGLEEHAPEAHAATITDKPRTLSVLTPGK